MNANRIRRTALPLGLAGVIATAMIAGASFSATAGARASEDRAPADAQAALAKGQVDKAITLAEALVASNPREPGYRALLGQAYLKAGRFQSAVTTFNDAMTLGDNSAKTALGLALANAANGNEREAVAVLNDWRDAIPAADLGLALALSGETSRGSTMLAEELRNGENSVKVRQNLAYALALDGHWREARLMVEQDVPADKVDARLSDWAAKARPEDSKVRIAGLLGAPLRDDPGQPTALALNASPKAEQLAAESSAAKAPAAPEPQGELPAVAAKPAESAASLASYAPVTEPAPAAVPVEMAAAPAVPAEAVPAEPAQSFASNFAEPSAPQAAPVQHVRPVRTAYQGSLHTMPRHGLSFAKGSSHNVQLGSFSSEQGARRAWGIFAARNPELKKFAMTITPAVVRGHNFWRVAAAGFNANGAQGLCSTVKARGGVCFAYAARPGLPTQVGGPAFAAAKPAAPAKVAAATPKPAAVKPLKTAAVMPVRPRHSAVAVAMARR